MTDNRAQWRAERDLMHKDLGELLDACGLGNYARPESSHEVMQQAIARVREIRDRAATAERQIICQQILIEARRYENMTDPNRWMAVNALRDLAQYLTEHV